MNLMQVNLIFQRCNAISVTLSKCIFLLMFCCSQPSAFADSAAIDAGIEKITGPDACGQDCHEESVKIWKKTKHGKSFNSLGRNNKDVRKILKNMGLKHIKKDKPCVNCHITKVMKGNKLVPVAGPACESCHGAGKDWIEVHADYGGKDIKRNAESVHHKQARIAKSESAGMVRAQNLYKLARRCFQCHLGHSEKLVNVGEHTPGSKIELVSWTQGSVGDELSIRHNIYYTTTNDFATPARRRILFVVGKALELEFSLRALAVATKKATFALRMAKRAKRAAVWLSKIAKAIPTAELQAMLASIRKAKIKLNNAKQLNAIADVIALQAEKFAALHNGENMAALDPHIFWSPDIEK